MDDPSENTAPDAALLRLLAELAGSPPAAIAELGSGRGSYVAALCAMGYDCRGVEPLRALHLEALRLHPGLAGEGISTQSSSMSVLGSARLINADMTEVFDMLRPPLALAFCLGGRIAELTSADELADVLLQLCDLTRPAGRVLIELPQQPGSDGDSGSALARLLADALESAMLKGVELEWLESDVNRKLGLLTHAGKTKF